jgi:hypothetical protein
MRVELDPSFVREFAAAYNDLYRSPADEREQHSFRLTRSREAEARLAEQFGAAQVEQYRAAGAEAAAPLAHVLASYARHVAALGVGPNQVRDYLARERRLLGELYHECRTPVPSPDKVRRLALQYALDARSPVNGHIRRFDVRCHAGVCGIGERPASPLLLTTVTPPSRTVHHPFAPLVLEAAYADTPAAHDIVGVIESLFGRAPDSRGERRDLGPATAGTPPPCESANTTVPVETPGQPKAPDAQRVPAAEAAVRLRQYFADLKLKPGDQLPTVGEIRSATGVSAGGISKSPLYRALRATADAKPGKKSRLPRTLDPRVLETLGSKAEAVVTAERRFLDQASQDERLRYRKSSSGDRQLLLDAFIDQCADEEETRRGRA